MANKLVGCMFCYKDSVVEKDTTECPHCKEERLVFVDDTDAEVTVVLSRRELEEELDELKAYKDETIWRVTTDDFISTLEVYPQLSDDDKAEIILKAYTKFHIEDWTEHVRAFIDSRLED